jgi:hypothetical protein
VHSVSRYYDLALLVIASEAVRPIVATFTVPKEIATPARVGLAMTW